MKMSFLRASANYVWCTTSVLGKGATAAVYQGVNKTNGEPVAVKTFNQLSHMRPQNVQMREFEVLKKVKHENIVKLLAIEEEQDGRGNVIVMELCTGGSLFNILDDPENTYGLEEKEFLLVVEHLTAGMKHLRDNNLVHRDLKPGKCGVPRRLFLAVRQLFGRFLIINLNIALRGSRAGRINGGAIKNTCYINCVEKELDFVTLC